MSRQSGYSPGSWKKSRYVLSICGGILFIVMVALIFAWQHVQTLSIGYRINELKQQKKQLEDQRRVLLLERASLIDYEVIEKKAKTTYGFQAPLTGQELHYDHKSGYLILNIPTSITTSHKSKSSSH